LEKTTIRLDNGDHPRQIQLALEQVYPEVMTKIGFELAPKPLPQAKAAKGQSGFVPVKALWSIERSNAGMERCKN
jgi:hypothetical protein